MTTIMVWVAVFTVGYGGVSSPDIKFQTERDCMEYVRIITERARAKSGMTNTHGVCAPATILK